MTTTQLENKIDELTEWLKNNPEHHKRIHVKRNRNYYVQQLIKLKENV